MTTLASTTAIGCTICAPDRLVSESSAIDAKLSIQLQDKYAHNNPKTLARSYVTADELALWQSCVQDGCWGDSPRRDKVFKSFEAVAPRIERDKVRLLMQMWDVKEVEQYVTNMASESGWCSHERATFRGVFDQLKNGSEEVSKRINDATATLGSARMACARALQMAMSTKSRHRQDEKMAEGTMSASVASIVSDDTPASVWGSAEASSVPFETVLSWAETMGIGQEQPFQLY